MHHAQLMIGKRDWCFSCLPEDVQTEDIDVRHLTFTRMSIADVRALIQDASLRPITRTLRTFVIYAEALPTETQNALLKLFEDPNETTIFFLIIPREDILLPTLRSRLHLIHNEKERGGESPDTEILSTFLAYPYAQRLDVITKKLNEEDVAWVESLVTQCALFAATQKSPHLIRDVLLVESHIRAHGSSKKILLEHLALSLPLHTGTHRTSTVFA
ncbi:MAG TPA: hypothetical protein VFV22_01450 [Candidatus Paceibacterota bacterium]|nr:hypothetical protein [Candidatus Paceibacterota bacterium]